MRYNAKSLYPLLAALVLTSFGASCTWLSPPATAPAAAGELVQGFVQETDSEFGYRVLRPQGWESIHLGDRRGYFPPELAGEPDRIVIGVTNFQTLASRSADDNALIVPWLLFRDSPTMEAWMQARERSWEAHGLSVERLRSTPNAAIHVVKPTADQISLVGHVIDKGQPLGISLDGYGAFSDYEKLEEEGLITAFETMLASLAALD